MLLDECFLNWLDKEKETEMPTPQKLELTGSDATRFLRSMQTVQRYAHASAVAKGFYPVSRMPTFGESIALIHSELSEALEAARYGNPESPNLPGHSHIAEELADAVIRILDLSGHRQIDLGATILAKMAYNQTRPIKHGKKF